MLCQGPLSRHVQGWTPCRAPPFTLIQVGAPTSSCPVNGSLEMLHGSRDAALILLGPILSVCAQMVIAIAMERTGFAETALINTYGPATPATGRAVHGTSFHAVISCSICTILRARQDALRASSGRPVVHDIIQAAPTPQQDRLGLSAEYYVGAYTSLRYKIAEARRVDSSIPALLVSALFGSRRSVPA
jgi:hypothetical protein